MDAYSILRAEAKQKRDIAIADASAQYRSALREIDRLGRKLNRSGRRSRYTSRINGDGLAFHAMTVTKAAETVLLESGPMTLVELTLEVQRRGCRTGDDPRRVMHGIRAAFCYHSERFRRDGDKRWSVVG